MKVVSVSRKKVVFYESMYVADPMDNPLNQHLISVTDDDTKTRANAKIPTFVKSITSPFEALHENAGEADPQTVTQLPAGGASHSHTDLSTAPRRHVDC